MKRVSKRRLAIASLAFMPCSVVCKGVLEWIEKPLDSLWRSFEEEQQGLPIRPPYQHPSSQIDQEKGFSDSNNNEEDAESSRFDAAPLPYHVDVDTGDAHNDAPPTEFPLLDAPRAMEIYGNQYDYDDSQDDGDDDDDSALTTGPALVYRFYGGKANLSSRTTRFSPTAIPFLCIGPNVDHWKAVAQGLSSRGFNVIACERVQPDALPRNNQQQKSNADAATDNARVIRKLLNALRWNQVVLVGCDSESLVTIQAALRLAPKRVVGLLLCGNLDATARQLLDEQDYRLLHQHQEQQQQQQQQGNRGEHSFISLTAAAMSRRKVSQFALDRFLIEKMPCPVRIIWDGDGTASARQPSTAGRQEPAMPFMSAASAFGSGASIRCQIIGGGSAPHRRRPEQFAWILSRFVEEQVAPTSIAVRKTLEAPRARGGQQQSDQSSTTEVPPSQDNAVDGHWNNMRTIAGKILSPFSFTVGGRMVATAIFYTVCLKVAIYQFENFRIGVNTVYSVRRRITDAILSLLSIVAPSESADITTPLADTDKETTSANEADKDGAEQPQPPHEHVVKPGPDSAEGDVQEDEFDGKEPSWDGRYRPSFFLDNVIA